MAAPHTIPPTEEQLQQVFQATKDLDLVVEQTPGADGLWWARQYWDAVVAAQRATPPREVGEIVLFGDQDKEVSWTRGRMPPAGTKLYAEPPAQLTEELLNALTLLLNYTKACEGVLNCKPAGQIAIAEAAIAHATLTSKGV